MDEIESLPTTSKESKQKGLKIFYTGKLCINGHLDVRFSNSGECRTCKRIYYSTRLKKIRKERPELIETKNRKQKEKYHNNIEESRKYERDKQKNRSVGNPEHVRSLCRKRTNKNYLKYKSSPKYVIQKTLRSRFIQAVKKMYKKTSCIELLGCSLEEFKLHIESQFKEGMTWNNHGIYTWHIDHIKPCASFDLSDIEQQKKCFHYSNMQPLWAIDNLKKGSNFS